MCISGEPRRPLPLTTGPLCSEPVHLIGGASASDVAAILCEGPWGIACWYNRRVVHGAMLGWLDLWAQRQVVTGWRFKALRVADLPSGLMG